MSMPRSGLEGKSRPSLPIEYIEYQICKRFGWTPVELDAQPTDRIVAFLTIMNIEDQREKKRTNQMKGQL